jgi:predicted cupin superfamily sugar epimerase
MTAPHTDSAYWISQLQLIQHPEGGYYREVYRSAEAISAGSLPSRFDGARSFSTSIYYLLESGDFSAFHRIKSDEVWHFYGGDPLELHILSGSEYQMVLIGRDLHAGHHLQYVVPHGAWFASRPAAGSSYCLLGCTVSPGFDFADFQMGSVHEVCGARADIVDLLRELCRS